MVCWPWSASRSQFVVPDPLRLHVQRDAEAVPGMLGSVLKNRELLRLDFGIFVQHAMLTASFLVVPGLLRGARRHQPKPVDGLSAGVADVGW